MNEQAYQSAVGPYAAITESHHKIDIGLRVLCLRRNPEAFVNGNEPVFDKETIETAMTRFSGQVSTGKPFFVDSVDVVSAQFASWRTTLMQTDICCTDGALTPDDYSGATGSNVR